MSGTLIKRHQRLIISFSLVVMSLSVFWPVTQNEFLIYDDEDYILENRFVSKGWTKDGFIWAFNSKLHGHWHPLTWLSHMTDVQLFGLDSKAHHLMNLLFHTASVLLLFRVLNRMTGTIWQSAFAAAVFAFHPLNVESVAWAAERKNVLSTLLWMLTLMTYVRYSEQPGLLRYLLTLSLFAMGMMSKVMIITLPCVLLLLDYWPLCRLRWGQSCGPVHDRFQKTSFLKLLLEKIPFFALGLITALLTLYLIYSGRGVRAGTSYLRENYVGINLVSYVEYLYKMFWPKDLTISYLAPYKAVLWQAVGSGILLAIITLFAFWMVRRMPPLLVGWLWYLGTLVPVLRVFTRAPLAIADRYMYIPMIGILLMVSWGVPELIGRWRRRTFFLGPLACAVIAVCITLTWSQLRYWQDSVSLFRHTLAIIPDHSLAHTNLGVALKRKGMLDEAISHFEKALKKRPDFDKALVNLAATLNQQGKTQEAIPFYEKAVQIKPNHPELHNDLGLALYRQGRIREATDHFLEAVSLNPRSSKIQNNVGMAYARDGEFSKAMVHFQEAVRLDPDFADAHNNMGNVFAEVGKIDDAVQAYEKALEINPSFVGARLNLGLTFLHQGKTDDAIVQFIRLIMEEPDLDLARFHLGRAYLTKGDREAALQVYEVLIRKNRQLARELYRMILSSLTGKVKRFPKE
jgi:tetratricopeptide (TPR) repeat protein